MGGGGSDRQPTMSDYSPDDQGTGLSRMSEFVASQGGQQYSGMFDQLKSKAGDMSKASLYKWEGDYTNYGLKGENGDYNWIDPEHPTDVNGLVNAYTAWLATQNQGDKQRKDYIGASNEYAGRDATILSGPAASKTILGG